MKKRILVIPVSYQPLTLFLSGPGASAKSCPLGSIQSGTVGALVKCHTAVDAFIFCSRIVHTPTFC